MYYENAIRVNLKSKYNAMKNILITILQRNIDEHIIDAI